MGLRIFLDEIGGPLVYYNATLNADFLVGVASISYTCQKPQFPPAYVDVGKKDIRDWIINTAAGITSG